MLGNRVRHLPVEMVARTYICAHDFMSELPLNTNAHTRVKAAFSSTIQDLISRGC